MFRQSGGNERVRVSLLILVFLGVFGCTPPMTIPMKGTMETAPATARVPLKLGVYYSPDFRNYSYTASPYMYQLLGPKGGSSVISPWGTRAPDYLTGCFPTCSPRFRAWTAVRPSEAAKPNSMLSWNRRSSPSILPTLISRRGLTPPRSPTALPSTPSVESRWPPGRSGALVASTGRLTLTSSAGRGRQ